MIAININDMVTVRLSLTGVRSARAIGCDPPAVGKSWRVELWRLMQVCAHAGGCWPLPLIDNRIDVMRDEKSPGARHPVL